MIPAWLTPLPWAIVAAVQFRLLLTGQILSFLHPKAVPLAWILATFCGLAALVEAWSLRRHAKPRRLSVGALAWALPPLSLLVAGQGGLSSQAAAARGVHASVAAMAASLPAGSEMPGDSLGEESYPVTEDTTADLPAPRTTVALPESMTKALSPRVLEQLDTIADDDFSRRVNRIWKDAAKWRGRTVVLTGFVTKDETFGAGGFFLTRMLLSCCAADAMPVGFFCQPLGEALPEGQWISVVAKVGITSAQLEGWKSTRTVPILTILSHARTKAPENPYVYPFSFEPDPQPRSRETLDLNSSPSGIP